HSRSALRHPRWRWGRIPLDHLGVQVRVRESAREDLSVAHVHLLRPFWSRFVRFTVTGATVDVTSMGNLLSSKSGRAKYASSGLRARGGRETASRFRSR